MSNGNWNSNIKVWNQKIDNSVIFYAHQSQFYYTLMLRLENFISIRKDMYNFLNYQSFLFYNQQYFKQNIINGTNWNTLYKTTYILELMERLYPLEGGTDSNTENKYSKKINI